jgi:thioredoxin reductase (NADPH)
MERSASLPVLLVVDDDASALSELQSDLSRRFGNDFRVRAETSSKAALAALQEIADENAQLALLLVDEAATDVLERAHDLHPRSKRVLLVDRDYTSTSPAVQAIALGRADYHIVRPWANDEMMYRAMSEYLSSWTREHQPNFELFRIVAAAGDSRVPQLRDVLTRFSLPFGFYPTDTEAGQRLLDEAGVHANELPALRWLRLGCLS